MPITREVLEKRLAELKQQAEQVKQQFHAISGASADTEYWIAQEDKPEVEGKEGI